MTSKLFAAFLSLWMVAAPVPVMAQQPAANANPQQQLQQQEAAATPQAQAAAQLETARKNLERLADVITKAKDD
ncbi:MAG: hypothetical protein AAAB11_16655, partial [Rhizobium giardinii]